MPMIEWIAGVPPSNYMTGREGNPVSLIVDHWMAGSFASALARFTNPTSIVSAHFLIGTTGRIAQVVATDDTAYHAGDWDTNLLSIGIEHEASPTLLPSDALYAASAWLHAHIAGIYGLHMVPGETVKGHRDIVPTACPGTLDLDRIVAEAATHGGNMATPTRIGQSAAFVEINPGEHALLQAIYQYAPEPSGETRPRTIVRKVTGSRPGPRFITVYPPVDPDDDESMDIDAEPTLFLVNVLPRT